MRISLILLALLTGLASCAAHDRTHTEAKPSARSTPDRARQELAWRVYLRIERGETVTLAEIEAKLGPSSGEGDRKAGWSFPDSDDFLVVSLSADGRATAAYWGLSYGANSKVSEAARGR